MKNYIVKKGDTIGKIAKTYKTSEQAIIKANNISNPNLIKINQELIIPPPRTRESIFEGFSNYILTNYPIMLVEREGKGDPRLGDWVSYYDGEGNLTYGIGRKKREGDVDIYGNPIVDEGQRVDEELAMGEWLTENMEEAINKYKRIDGWDSPYINDDRKLALMDMSYSIKGKDGKMWLKGWKNSKESLAKALAEPNPLKRQDLWEEFAHNLSIGKGKDGRALWVGQQKNRALKNIETIRTGEPAGELYDYPKGVLKNDATGYE